MRALKLTNAVKMRRCRLIGGPFIEAKFGPEGEDAQADPWIADCDFSAADLRDVRFYQTPQDTLVLPAWPYITVVARDNATVFARPSERHPALNALMDDVEDHAWEALPLQRAVEALVAAVGVRPHEASVQVCHAEDLVRWGVRSVERQRAALDRFAHPAIR